MVPQINIWPMERENPTWCYPVGRVGLEQSLSPLFLDLLLGEIWVYFSCFLWAKRWIYSFVPGGERTWLFPLGRDNSSPDTFSVRAKHQVTLLTRSYLLIYNITKKEVARPNWQRYFAVHSPHQASLNLQKRFGVKNSTSLLYLTNFLIRWNLINV